MANWIWYLPERMRDRVLARRFQRGPGRLPSVKERAAIHARAVGLVCHRVARGDDGRHVCVPDCPSGAKRHIGRSCETPGEQR